MKTISGFSITGINVLTRDESGKKSAIGENKVAVDIRRVTTIVDRELHQKLNITAIKFDTNVSEIVRALITSFVEQLEANETKEQKNPTN